MMSKAYQGQAAPAIEDKYNPPHLMVLESIAASWLCAISTTHKKDINLARLVEDEYLSHAPLLVWVAGRRPPLLQALNGRHVEALFRLLMSEHQDVLRLQSQYLHKLHEGFAFLSLHWQVQKTHQWIMIRCTTAA